MFRVLKQFTCSYTCYDTNFHLEDGDTIFLWNVGNTSHCHIVQKPQNETSINPLMMELTPSVQCCQTRFFYRSFASWTLHFVNICVKNQQIHQLFIQFINYVW
jgi:hypothetical protein